MFYSKKDRCVSDGCVNRKAYSIVFLDGARGQYCEDCTDYMQHPISKNNFFGIKSVKSLVVVKEVGTL